MGPRASIKRTEVLRTGKALGLGSRPHSGDDTAQAHRKEESRRAPTWTWAFLKGAGMTMTQGAWNGGLPGEDEAPIPE